MQCLATLPAGEQEPHRELPRDDEQDASEQEVSREVVQASGTCGASGESYAPTSKLTDISFFPPPTEPGQPARRGPPRMDAHPSCVRSHARTGSCNGGNREETKDVPLDPAHRPSPSAGEVPPGPLRTTHAFSSRNDWGQHDHRPEQVHRTSPCRGGLQ